MKTNWEDTAIALFNANTLYDCKHILKDFLEGAMKSSQQSLKNKIDVLIAKEMIIATKEGQTTSRLTSLANKISKL